MKYSIIIFLLLLNSSWSFAQTSICERDTVTTVGKLLTKIIDESQSGVTIRFPNSEEEYNAKRLCFRSYLIIDSLNNIISNEEIEELSSCENNALKATAFILFSNRNTKGDVIAKFKTLLDGKTGFMTNSCSDAIQTETFQRFCLELLIEKNYLYRPKFKLSKKERKELEDAVNKYEKEFWEK